MRTSLHRHAGWLGLAGVVVVVAIWWVTSVAVDSFFYPPLPEVLRSAVEFWFTGQGASHLASSLINLFSGLLIGILVGWALGLVIGQIPAVRAALTPGLEFIRAIPATALIPFAMVLFGLGPTMKTVIIALGTFFPVLLAVIDGVRSIPRQTLEAARSYGVTGWQRQWHVVIPACLPRAITGVRIAVPLSLILVVTSEMTGSDQGIGYALIVAQNSFDQVSVWAAILLLGVLGVLLEGILSLIQARPLAWHRQSHNT